MLVGLLADIHSNLEALEAVLQKLKNCDHVLCAGDLVGYGANPNEVIKKFKERNILSVKGNHDAAVAGEMSLNWFNRFAQEAILWTRERIEQGNKQYLKELPLRIKKTIDEIDIFVVHGGLESELKEYIHHPSNLGKYKKETASDLIVTGHTHIPSVWQLNSNEKEIKYKEILLNKFTLFNPGSVGQSRDGHPLAYYGVLNTDNNVLYVKSTSYDIQKAANKIMQTELPKWLGKRLLNGM